VLEIAKYFFYQCVAHPENSTSKKAVDSEDHSHGKCETPSKCYTDDAGYVVGNALNDRSLETDNTH
jgi:hypothetical protein